MKNIFVLLFLLFLPFVYCYAGEAGSVKSTGSTGETITLDDPLQGKANLNTKDGINTYIGTIINNVLGVIGSLALIMFIYGGFTWMTSAGNNDRVTKGKNIVIWATVGE